jgi:hypothetical protein
LLTGTSLTAEVEVERVIRFDQHRRERDVGEPAPVKLIDLEQVRLIAGVITEHPLVRARHAAIATRTAAARR